MLEVAGNHVELLISLVFCLGSWKCPPDLSRERELHLSSLSSCIALSFGEQVFGFTVCLCDICLVVWGWSSGWKALLWLFVDLLSAAHWIGGPSCSCVNVRETTLLTTDLFMLTNYRVVHLGIRCSFDFNPKCLLLFVLCFVSTDYTCSSSNIRTVSMLAWVQQMHVFFDKIREPRDSEVEHGAVSPMIAGAACRRLHSPQLYRPAWLSSASRSSCVFPIRLAKKNHDLSVSVPWYTPVHLQETCKLILSPSAPNGTLLKLF